MSTDDRWELPRAPDARPRACGAVAVSSSLLPGLRRRNRCRLPGTRPRRVPHRDWLNTLRFDDPASEATFQDDLHAHDALLGRRDELDATIERVAKDCVFADQVIALRCLRGVSTLTALALCAEVRDFQRFGKPTQLSAFLGIVPSENTSGEKRRQGSITKAGSVHARRLLVEAAWHYRKPPRMSSTLKRRQNDAPAAAIDCAWRAQRRLYQRWQLLETERGKRPAIVAIAVARELSHFCWETATTA